MLNKKRVKIPQEISDAVMFEADKTCCVCRRQSLSVHIHHIDGNPANNSQENLVVLCLEDHAQVSAKQAMGRGITPGLLRKYKDEWCSAVRARKEQTFGKMSPGAGDVAAYLEALACHEIRKSTFHIDRKDWKEVSKCLTMISPYSESWLYGDAVRHEVLDLLYSLACATRNEMPEEVAEQISHMASGALPIVSLVAKAQRKPDASQLALFELALNIGFSVAHDGVKYLKNIRIAKAGLHLLHQVLRYSHLNSLGSLKKAAMGNFEHFIEVAGYASNEKAIEWGNFERDDALALDGMELPKMPK